MHVDALESRVSLSAAAMGLVGMEAIRAHPVFSQYDGTGSTIVVIDQPINWNSSHLLNRRVTDIDVLGGSGPIDGETHGTFVASIVAAEAAQVGVAPGAGLIGTLSDGSVPPVGTNPNEVWRLDENDIERLLRWVIDNREQYNIVAVNLSLGDGRWYTSSNQVAQRVLNDEIAELENDGVFVVAAAGNDYEEDQTRNAAYPAIVSTFAVGAVFAADVGAQGGNLTTGVDHVAAFSQRPPVGSNNGLFAPGAGVVGILGGVTFATGSGTSFAAPYVSGAIAILQQAAMELSGERMSVDALYDVIVETADTVVDGDDEDDTVANTGASFGRLNVLRALEEVTSRFSEANLRVLGGSLLDQVIQHETKAKRSNGTGFGPVEREEDFKEALFFLRNTGTEPLSISGVEIRGQSPEHFTVTLQPGATIEPGGTAAVVVRFDPQLYGTVRANMAVFSNDPDRPRFTVRIAGNGMPPDSAADIAASGGPGDIRNGDRRARATTGTKFGVVEVGEAPVVRVFILTNRGGSTLSLELSQFEVTGANPGDFVITPDPTFTTLGPNQATTFSVRFAPTAVGLRRADIVLVSDDPDEAAFTFRVVGTGR